MQARAVGFDVLFAEQQTDDPLADDLFAGANHRNLQRARNSLGTWGEGNDAARVVVDDFDAKVRQACSEEPAQSDARANCKAMY